MIIHSHRAHKEVVSINIDATVATNEQNKPVEDKLVKKKKRSFSRDKNNNAMELNIPEEQPSVVVSEEPVISTNSVIVDETLIEDQI